jgi:hypothetical protein
MIIEHKNGIERVLKVRWTPRCLGRVKRWLRLEYDFGGFILKNGKRIGYKTAGPGLRHMYFHFPEYKMEGDHDRETEE